MDYKYYVTYLVLPEKKQAFYNFIKFWDNIKEKDDEKKSGRVKAQEKPKTKTEILSFPSFPPPPPPPPPTFPC